MSAASFAALGDVMSGSQVAALFTPDPVDVPAGFKVVLAESGEQMIGSPADSPLRDAEIVTLGAADVPAMMALTELTKPGPFAARTHQLGTFFGILWVVAFSEELFFRGVIAKALLEWKKSMAIAIGVSSVAFGSAHLWMRDFPNWKMACAASIAGIFFARAYFLGGSVRAAMVTHALAVTTWRMLFR